MTKELLIKFLNDQCSRDELKEVVRWIKNESTDYSNVWAWQEWKDYKDDQELPGDERLGSVLDKIHHKINISTKRVEERKSIDFTFTWVTRIAALMLLPVLAFLLYTLNRNSGVIAEFTLPDTDTLEVVTPVGSKTRVHLSDGTEVYLNHGSSLKYPQKFLGDTREVSLTGEGYFIIRHNPEKPFIVKTQNLNIRAIGTSFNVFAYPNENFVSTTLVEGKVVVEQKMRDNKIQVVGAMLPGQHLSYNFSTGKISASSGDNEKYISWKDGKLVFKRDSIQQIANRLCRWYNVDIEFADVESKQFTYTATFMDEPLYHILDILKEAAPIEYKILPRRTNSDGSFSKQKIIISKRNN